MPIQSKSWLTGSSSSSPMLKGLSTPGRVSRPNTGTRSSYDWIRSQPFDYEAYAMGTAPDRAGTILGGFTAAQSFKLSDLRSELVIPDPPKLTQSILNGKAESANSKIGQLQIEMIAPFDTLTQLTGSFAGIDPPLVGEAGQWFDPGAFFESKDMSNLDQIPSRLGDYAWNLTFGLPGLVYQQATGAPMPTLVPKDQDYAFQKTNTYWPYVGQATDEQLRTLAREVTQKYADPDTNQYLVDKLYNQFVIDRNKMTGLTSGNARTDFIAKKRLENYLDMGLLPKEVDGGASIAALQTKGPWNKDIMQLGQHDLGASNFAAFIPVIGTQLDETFNPVKPSTEKLWTSLTRDQRLALLDATGLYSMASEFVGAMLVLAPAGAVAAGVKGTATLGGRVLKAYDTVLNLSKAKMAVGVTGATATWAAAAAFPDNEFIQGLTQRIDQSRPVSTSHFAGAVNALGMFSSGTYGINTAIRMDARALKALGSVTKLDKGIGTITRGAMSGMPDLRFYRYGFGGSEMVDFMSSKVGLPAQELKVGVQRVFMSETLNSVRDRWRAGWTAILDGADNEITRNLTPEQKMELQAMQAARLTETSTVEAEHIVRTMGKAREDQPLGLWVNGADRIREFANAVRNARSWDDGMARRFLNQYDSAFITRLAGSDTPEAMRTWLGGAITRLGGNSSVLPSPKGWSVEKWRNATRLIYHAEFNRWSDAIAAASGGAEEATRISIMSQRHLFRDEADAALTALRGDDEALAIAKMEELLGSKVELEAWHATEVRSSARRGPGAPVWEPTPAKMADHIEDIYEALSARRHLPDQSSPEALDALNYVHGQMEEEGLWTIGYKPVNEAGDHVLHIQTRTGQIVESPWVNYPLDNLANVELGNRGFMAAKLDAVTQGFRTWRVLEYQKASLFRSLSDRTDLTPTQIETFHQGVMDLARKHNVSPQAVGRMPSWAVGLRSVSQEVNDLAERVFGGVVKDKEGKVINWRREVGNAYRQAYRLNLTSGLTSHLKGKFGPIGEGITYGSDFIYVMWRFGLSPLFKAGEIWESSQLNLMRRVYPGDDPYVAALYVRAGAGSDPAIVATERTLDPMIQGMDSTLDPSGFRAGIAPARERVVNQSAEATADLAQRRAASSLGFYALNLPEDHAAVVARSAMREQAKRYRAQAMGGEAIRTNDRGRLMAELANSVDENGMLVNGADYGRLREVLRQLNREDLDPQVAAALDAHPWGVPSAAQLARAAALDERAMLVKSPTLTDVERTDIWRQAIADGHMPPDAALALRDRYDELRAALRSEREANRAWRAGSLSITTSHPDLTDPVTGLPVIRLPAEYASEDEFTHALRSLGQRRSRVKVTVPSAEDIAIRLEAAAEAQRQTGIPIFRSDHVGPRDSIPEGFTTDPAELFLEGEVNHSLDPNIGLSGSMWDANGNLIISTQSKDGVASWLDLNTHDPATAGLYHVTTAHDAVLETGGLKSRHEVLIMRRPPEMIAALDAAYNGPNGLAPYDIKFVTLKGDIYHTNHENLRDFLDGNKGYFNDSGGWGKILPQDLAEIRNTRDGVVLWTRPKGGVPRVPEGLSATTIDTKVSFATTKEHSDTVVERYVVGGQAARGEIDGQGVIDHYLPYYERLIQRAIDEGTYVLPMKTHYVTPTQRTVREDALVHLHKAIGQDLNGMVDEADLYDNLLSAALVDHYPNDPGKTQWALFNSLDRDLQQMKARVGLAMRKDVFSGAVTFVGDVNVARQWKREQVAVLQVAVRKNRGEPLDVNEFRAAALALFDQTPAARPVRIELADGQPSAFPRWMTQGPQWAPDGSMIPPSEIKVGGMTEREHFEQWLDEHIANTQSGFPEDQITALIAHDDTTVLGLAKENYDQITARGKDDLEIEVHSKNLYVIDDRIDGEPLADDAEGLLRQLRQIIDEEGNPVPGYERRHAQIVHDLTQLRDESINPDPVTSAADIPEEPAGATRNLRSRVQSRWERAKGKAAKLGEDFWDPVPGKEAKEAKLVAQMQREEFPRVMAGTGVARVFRELGIPEQKQADFLVTDRALLDRWTATQDPEDLQRLIEHAGGTEDRAALDALYNSEEWKVISGLWSLNLQGASEEAFGVHFFDQYRSPLLRSMNHPVLGVYPAAWALKTAREWAKFLFDNRMFGVDLRLGMTPAVAIAETARAQQVAFAQQNPEYDGTLEDYMREGPLGSTIFVFNLLMPGDWSALPFPLSRTLREILRTGEVNPGELLAQNLTYLGVTRDLRLMGEVADEVKSGLFPPTPEPNVPRPKKWSKVPKGSTPTLYDVPTR